jgi:hypothetical protein
VFNLWLWGSKLIAVCYIYDAESTLAGFVQPCTK